MILFCLIFFFCVLNSCHFKHLNKRDRERMKHPNIILILTDDQDVELGSLNYMPKLARFVEEHGVTFKNAFTTTPMCCPSRSSILTGMYVHNHNTYTNNDNCSSPQWRTIHEPHNFGAYLSNAGYRTGYFGKYLNEYTGDYIPVGWKEWMGLVRNTRYYNYTLNHNGKKIKHENIYAKDYFTDVITNNSINFLRQSKLDYPEKGVAMVLSMPAPHGPEDAAPQYQHLFKNVNTHRTHNWNFAPNPDKQWLLQYTEKMLPIQKRFTDVLQMKRLQTLQSVDDAIERIWREVIQLREHHNTYLIYTSDHGYHLGQYGLVKGKAMPYEFDIKIPFVMRGPKVPANVKMPNIVLNVDIAPTLLDIAGVVPPSHMDGESILKLFEEKNYSYEPSLEYKQNKFWRDTFLVERGKLTPRKLKVLDKLEARVNKLDKPIEKLEDKCNNEEYRSPCVPNQKWECKKLQNDRYRLYKCRHPKCSCKNKFLYHGDKQEEKIESNSQKSTKIDTNHSIKIPCHLLSNNSVECESFMYEDSLMWNQYKFNISKLIDEFSNATLYLKKIRDHLKLNQPTKKIQANKISENCNCIEQENVLQDTDEINRMFSRSRKQFLETMPNMTSSKAHGSTASETWKGVDWSQYRSRDDPFCHVDGLECTRMDNDHWKVPPYWTDGPFCFCPNSNNNTYWCLRTINDTHNFIYCEFITGFISFYDVKTDPYQLRNAVHDLKYSRLHQLHKQLEKMKGCKGRKCNPNSSHFNNQYFY